MKTSISTAVAASAVASVTAAVTVGTNNDKTGYGLLAAYDLAKTAAQAGDAMTLTAGERVSVADKFLDRDMSVGTDSGDQTVRTVRQALRFLRNGFAIDENTGVVTVFKEDGVSASWTTTATSNAAAEPITGLAS